MRMLTFGLLIFGLALGAARAADPPRVVVSIKPLHSLAAALLDGIAEPELLLQGAASPHAHALRPSERRALEEADLVIWVGPGLESFLVKPVSVLPARVRVVGLLAETPGLHRLALAENDHGHKDHGHKDHGHGHKAHADHGTVDPHIWLSPENARAIARHLATVLAPLTDSERLAANAAALDRRLVALEAELAGQLAPVRERPFVVFHAAYDYFVEAFDLHQAGALTLTPEQGASARHLSQLRAKLAATGAVCVFREPQFDDRGATGLARGTDLRLGVLDPLGADVPAGAAAYERILRNLATGLVNCLAE